MWTWTPRDEAERPAKEVMNIPAVANWMQHITDDGGMQLGAVLDGS